LPVEGLIDKSTGDIDDNWRQFFDQLINTLQKFAGEEGIVLPPQAASNITIIQNNQLQNLSYTCNFGTGLYNSTANSIMFAINNGSGAPIFKTATLT